MKINFQLYNYSQSILLSSVPEHRRTAVLDFPFFYACRRLLSFKYLELKLKIVSEEASFCHFPDYRSIQYFYDGLKVAQQLSFSSYSRLCPQADGLASTKQENVFSTRKRLFSNSKLLKKVWIILHSSSEESLKKIVSTCFPFRLFLPPSKYCNFSAILENLTLNFALLEQILKCSVSFTFCKSNFNDCKAVMAEPIIT